MPPHPFTLRQIWPQPSQLAGNDASALNNCSDFVCWSRGEQIGTISGIAAGSIAVLGLMYFFGFTNGNKRRSQRIQTRLPHRAQSSPSPPETAPTRANPPAIQLLRTFAVSPSGAVLESRKFVAPRVISTTVDETSQGFLKDKIRLNGRAIQTLDACETDCKRKRPREDSGQRSTGSFGRSARTDPQSFEQAQRSVQISLTDPGPYAGCAQGLEGRQDEAVAKPESSGDEKRRYRRAREYKSNKNVGTEAKERREKSEYQPTDRKEKVVNIIKELLNDSKWLPILLAVLNLLDTFGEPKSSWNQFHQNTKSSPTRGQISRSTQKKADGDWRRKGRSTPRRDRQSSRGRGDRSGQTYNQRLRRPSGRLSPTQQKYWDDNRTSKHRRSRFTERSKRSRGDASRFTHATIRPPPPTRRRNGQIPDSKKPTQTRSTRFRDTVSVAPSSTEYSVKHMPLNDFRNGNAGTSSRSRIS